MSRLFINGREVESDDDGVIGVSRTLKLAILEWEARSAAHHKANPPKSIKELGQLSPVTPDHVLQEFADEKPMIMPALKTGLP